MFSSSFTMSEQKHRQWTPYKARRASPDGPLRLYLLDSSVSVKRNYVRRSRRKLR